MHYNDNNYKEYCSRFRLIAREMKGTESNNEEGNHECVYGEHEVRNITERWVLKCSGTCANETVKVKVANSTREIW